MTTLESNPEPGAAVFRAYHARTKHRIDAYAEGPGQLDWDAQPAAFRHYPGAPMLELPLSAGQFERCYGQLSEKPKSPIAPNLASVGAVLELTFGLSAWKSWGPNRWALRCNPYSGNLHPVEAYVLSHGITGIPPGLQHYDPENHRLEGRALTLASRAEPWLAIGLSSIMWREAWKYGERAFRYCQLDVGHAVGALAYAAALLGWEIEPLAIAGQPLAHCLGLDRIDDFPPSRYAFTESEEPEMLLALRAPGLNKVTATEVVRTGLAGANWQGKPSRIDPSPGYRWPVIDQAAAASSATSLPLLDLDFAAQPPLAPHQTTAGPGRSFASGVAASASTPRAACPKPLFTACLMPFCPARKCPGWRRKSYRKFTCCSLFYE